MRGFASVQYASTRITFSSRLWRQATPSDRVPTPLCQGEGNGWRAYPVGGDIPARLHACERPPTAVASVSPLRGVSLSEDGAQQCLGQAKRTCLQQLGQSLVAVMEQRAGSRIEYTINELQATCDSALESVEVSLGCSDNDGCTWIYFEVPKGSFLETHRHSQRDIKSNGCAIQIVVMQVCSSETLVEMILSLCAVGITETTSDQDDLCPDRWKQRSSARTTIQFTGWRSMLTLFKSWVPRPSSSWQDLETSCVKPYQRLVRHRCCAHLDIGRTINRLRTVYLENVKTSQHIRSCTEDTSVEGQLRTAVRPCCRI